MNGATFDLRRIIRGVLATSAANNPRDLAVRVLADIPVEWYSDALTQALPALVREAISADRRGFTPPPSSPPQSNKVKAIRENWRRHLDTRWHVGGAEWKTLAECTRQDLLFAAQERRAQAEENLVVAAKLHALSDLMDQQNVETVAQLSDNILSTVLGRAA